MTSKSARSLKKSKQFAPKNICSSGLAAVDGKPSGRENMKIMYPRPKSDELTEALAHRAYFQVQCNALIFAGKRIADDLRTCEREKTKWETRIEQLGWLDSNDGDKT